MCTGWFRGDRLCAVFVGELQRLRHCLDDVATPPRLIILQQLEGGQHALKDWNPGTVTGESSPLTSSRRSDGQGRQLSTIFIVRTLTVTIRLIRSMM